MNIVDRLIREWSWRFEKGYPDLSNPRDIEIIEDFIGIPSEYLLETNLSRSQLKKYDSRVYRFIDKFKDSEPFEMIDGKQFIPTKVKIGGREFTQEDDREEIFSTFEETAGSIYLTGTVDGKEEIISSTSLKKTTEFGGKEKGSSTKIEDEELRSINSLIQKVEGGNSIKVKIGDEVYEDIVSATTVPGTPKADFTLNNSKGDPVIFLSHKDGTTAKDFQQYGGVSELKDYDEVLGFVNDVKSALQDPTQMERGSGFRRQVESEEIIVKSVYGVDFTPGKDFGINNVTALVQGGLKLEKSGDIYNLTSRHTILNPDLPQEDYAPAFYATFRKNRNQFGIKDIRFGIYTNAYRPRAEVI